MASVELSLDTAAGVLQVDATIPRPINCTLGRVTIHAQMVRSRAFQALLRFIGEDRSHLYDAMVTLFMCYAPESLLINMPEEKRYLMVSSQNYVSDGEFSRKLRDVPEFRELRSLYESVVSTPAMRLYKGLLENTERYIKDAADMILDNENMEQVLAHIEFGEKLYKQLENIKALVDKEAVDTVRSNHRIRLFEDPSTHETPQR